MLLAELLNPTHEPSDAVLTESNNLGTITNAIYITISGCIRYQEVALGHVDDMKMKGSETCDVLTPSEALDLKEKLSCPVPPHISPTLVRLCEDTSVCQYAVGCDSDSGSDE